MKNQENNSIYNSIKNKQKFGNNLTKEVKNFNTENYIRLLKEIEVDTSEWNDSPHSWIRRIKTV